MSRCLPAKSVRLGGSISCQETSRERRLERDGWACREQGQDREGAEHGERWLQNRKGQVRKPPRQAKEPALSPRRLGAP